MAGVFISRGTTVAIPQGGLRLAIGHDGKLSGDLTVHLRFDVCSTWADLALRHLDVAKTNKKLRDTAWGTGDADQQAAALEREFEASMQAIMAAATAIDAFYSVVKTCISLPIDLVDKWRQNRTPRYGQVAEVLKRGFKLKPGGSRILRQNLGEIYRFRDLAVHPSGKSEAAILHPELGVGVEWRFAYFRAHSAELIVNEATWILWDLAHGGKPENPQLKQYINSLRQRLEVLFPIGHPSCRNTDRKVGT